MPHLNTAQAILVSSTLVVAGLTVWRGTWEERTVAVGLLIEVTATSAFEDSRDPLDARLGGMILAIIYVIALFWVALRSGKGWPLWAAAFQLVGVGFFLARMADPKISALALAVWSYLILIAVGVGTLAGPRRPAAPHRPLL